MSAECSVQEHDICGETDLPGCRSCAPEIIVGVVHARWRDGPLRVALPP